MFVTWESSLVCSRMRLNIEQDESESRHLTGYSSGICLWGIAAENPGFCTWCHSLMWKTHLHRWGFGYIYIFKPTLLTLYSKGFFRPTRSTTFNWDPICLGESNFLPGRTENLVGSQQGLAVETCFRPTVAEYLTSQTSHKGVSVQLESLSFSSKPRRGDAYDLVETDISMLLCRQWIRCGAIFLAHGADVCVWHPLSWYAIWTILAQSSRQAQFPWRDGAMRGR